MIEKEKIFSSAARVTGIFVIAVVLVLPAVLILHSLPVFEKSSIPQLLFSGWKPSKNIYGLGSFILTSLLTAILSSVLAFGISLSAAVYIYFRRKTRYGKLLFRSVKVMSGIPTVVYGLAGIMLIVPTVRYLTPSSSGLCLFSVVLVLTVLIIPTMTVYIADGIGLVPREHITAALSLGASEPQLLLRILLPSAKKYLVIAVILGFSRAVSDTMIALMISGNAFRFPDALFKSARNVTSHIALQIPGEFSGVEFRAVFFSALVLIVIVIAVNYAAAGWEKRR